MTTQTPNTPDLGELDKLVAELRGLSELEGAWYANVGKKTGERCCAAMRQAADALAAERSRAEALAEQVRAKDALYQESYSLGSQWRARAEALEKELAKAREWSPNDREDQWTPAIRAAHPMRSDDPKVHDHFGTAMDMVGGRRSKFALVELVSWLIGRADKAEAEVAGLKALADAAVYWVREHDLQQNTMSADMKLFGAARAYAASVAAIPANALGDNRT